MRELISKYKVNKIYTSTKGIHREDVAEFAMVVLSAALSILQVMVPLFVKLKVIFHAYDAVKFIYTQLRKLKQ